jgi:hypothetical protein
VLNIVLACFSGEQWREVKITNRPPPAYRAIASFGPGFTVVFGVSELYLALFREVKFTTFMAFFWPLFLVKFVTIFSSIFWPFAGKHKFSRVWDFNAILGRPGH